MADFTFTLPPGPVSLEGGGAYIQKLTTALEQAGHVIHPVGTALPGVIRIIDGAALPRVSPEQTAGAVGLIHHLTALAAEDDHVAVRKAERERLALLRCIVVTNTPVRDRLVGEFAVDAARITVVHPGVPDAPRSTGSGGPACAVLSVGALTPRKGHAVLIRALARLFDLDWRLVIVGDTERENSTAPALRDLVRQAGVAGRVRFAGALDAAALEAEWQRADVFALATEWEGYGSAVAEALRRGVPVAVTSGGAAAELVTPETGVVCPPGDADGLSKAMRRLIFDTGLRADMAEAAWQAGRTLPDWAEQAARFVEAVQCC